MLPLMSVNKKHCLFLLLLWICVHGTAQDTQGFFLNGFETKSARIPSFIEYTKPTASASIIVNVDMNNIIANVPKFLFGNNCNLYMSQMVDQPGLLKNISTVSPHVIRFPGGNLSSVYFWNAPKNQPPTDAPAKLIDSNGSEQNPNYWFGQNTEDWTLSLDNYYKMLEATGNTGMITINYGYARYSTAIDPVAAAAHLAAEWVRYDRGRTQFWEIGNESNGTWQAGYRINTSVNRDRQPLIATGALYGSHFKVFADSMRKAAKEVKSVLYIGAQLLQEEPANWATATDKNWNQGVLQQSGDVPDYYIIHSYYTPYQTNSTPAVILNSALKVTNDMMTYVKSAIVNSGVKIKPIALTEWNIFAEGSKQQISFISGMHAALVLGELIKNKYGMASRWNLSNGYNNGNDHGMFSKGDEPGNIPKWNARPVFYYMYYFQKYFGDQMVSSTVSGNADIIAYASKFGSGQAGIVIVNKGITEQIASVDLANFGYGDRFYIYTLTGGTDNGDFSLKVNVNGETSTWLAGGPPDVENIPSRSSLITDGIKIIAPKKSVTYILVENGNHIITAVDDKNSAYVKVFPNPSSKGFEVELSEAGFYRAQLNDSAGKEILVIAIDKSQTHFSIPQKEFAKGAYVLKITKDQKIIYVRVMVD